jgi:hypothetical protein
MAKTLKPAAADAPPLIRMWWVQAPSCPRVMIPAETESAAKAMFREQFFLGAQHPITVAPVDD